MTPNKATGLRMGNKDSSMKQDTLSLPDIKGHRKPQKKLSGSKSTFSKRAGSSSNVGLSSSGQKQMSPGG